MVVQLWHGITLFERTSLWQVESFVSFSIVLLPWWHSLFIDDFYVSRNVLNYNGQRASKENQSDAFSGTNSSLKKKKKTILQPMIVKSSFFFFLQLDERKKLHWLAFAKPALKRIRCVPETFQSRKLTSKHKCLQDIGAQDVSVIVSNGCTSRPLFFARNRQNGAYQTKKKRQAKKICHLRMNKDAK